MPVDDSSDEDDAPLREAPPPAPADAVDPTVELLYRAAAQLAAGDRTEARQLAIRAVDALSKDVTAPAPRRAGAMVGLDALPRWARENVVRLLRPADALRALPFVSGKTLAALQGLRLPIGEYKALTVEAAVQQAHALRRAWDLGALNLSSSTYFHVGRRVTDVWRGCARLHTLNLPGCYRLTDVSVLASFAALQRLHTLNLSECSRVSDLSG
mmetsp:Transcript_18372/g.57404  ORF Transcript_18372/g.57404 Transcript_18372/m.57404 type:complete len:213 (+) Transcript_18372:272-910(+)